ncbi:MAG: FecR domain-containing protein [Planctomycetota bacterium]|jgi:ferric-dicitrate binding protein FerR (iron transport regulator)
MNCKDIQPLFSKMIDRSMSDDEEKTALDHLSACDSCRKRYADLNRISGLITESLSSHPFNERLINHTLNLLPSRRLPVVSERRRFGAVRWVAAAAAIILVAVGLVLTFTGPGEKPPKTAGAMPPAESVTVALKTGDNNLKDGSRIALWKGASGNVEYGEKETVVKLESGTLYASVTKQKEGKEFAVLTKDMKVIVVGTEFFVEINDTGTECTVKEGKVNCIPLKKEKSSKYVSAGYKFSSAKPAGISRVADFPVPAPMGAATPAAVPEGASSTDTIPPSIGEPDHTGTPDPTGDNSVDTDMPLGPKKKNK